MAATPLLVAQGYPDCDSDDIVQDTILIAWTRWKTITYYDNPKAYLNKVAIRLWHRAATHRGQTGSHDEEQERDRQECCQAGSHPSARCTT